MSEIVKSVSCPTALMTGILIKRQFHSGSQAAVEAYLEMVERP